MYIWCEYQYISNSVCNLYRAYAVYTACEARRWVIGVSAVSTDLSPLSRGGGFSSDDASQQQTPDSGAVSDIYSIPHSSHHHRHDVTSDTVNDDDTRTYVNAADDDELAHMERDIKWTSWLMANNTDTVKQ